MKYKVLVTEQAHAEADSAFKWIENSSPQNAYEWFNGLVDAIETLETMPERCVTAPESEEVGRVIRQRFHGKFRILFSIEEQTVYVLHIRHGHQRHLSKDKF
jgi:plasmid stabilization system protein ParE